MLDWPPLILLLKNDIIKCYKFYFQTKYFANLFANSMVNTALGGGNNYADSCWVTVARSRLRILQKCLTPTVFDTIVMPKCCHAIFAKKGKSIFAKIRRNKFGGKLNRVSVTFSLKIWKFPFFKIDLEDIFVKIMNIYAWTKMLKRLSHQIFCFFLACMKRSVGTVIGTSTCF